MWLHSLWMCVVRLLILKKKLRNWDTGQKAKNEYNAEISVLYIQFIFKLTVNYIFILFLILFDGP